jgi:hypothetical protein
MAQGPFTLLPFENPPGPESRWGLWTRNEPHTPTGGWVDLHLLHDAEPEEPLAQHLGLGGGSEQKDVGIGDMKEELGLEMPLAIQETRRGALAGMEILQILAQKGMEEAPAVRARDP